MSILAYHHMISQQFVSHPAFRDIDKQKFGIDSIANGIYLPVDYQLAAAMGISPHPGGHNDIYYEAIKCVLDRIAKIPEPDVRAVKIRTLTDAMRIGFTKGDLYTNLPNGKTLEEVKAGIDTVIKHNEVYVEQNPDLLERFRNDEQKGLEAGHDHLPLWSAILGDARREELLHKAIESNPNVNVTSGNKHLRGTPYSKFAPVDDNFQIPPTTPDNPRDIPLPPPFFPPFLEWLSEPEGFARSDPRFTRALPPFPQLDPNEQRIGQLPPTTAAPSDPFVLKSDPHSGLPDQYHDNPLAGGTSPERSVLPWLAGGAAVLAAPFVPAWLLAIGSALALSRAVNAQESTRGATTGSAAPRGGVLSAGESPLNITGTGLHLDDTAGNSGSLASSTFGQQQGHASSIDPETRASAFADRFGNWVSTQNGSMPAEPTNVGKAPDTPAAGSVAPENARHLARVNESNAGSVFTSGTSPVPYLPSTEFNERFGSWAVPSVNSGQPQPSRPIASFADEPSYLIPPPIFGVDGRSGAHTDAEEWFSRWIRPLLPPQ